MHFLPRSRRPSFTRKKRLALHCVVHQTWNPSARRHALCASISAAHFSSPCSTMHSSRAWVVWLICTRRGRRIPSESDASSMDHAHNTHTITPLARCCRPQPNRPLQSHRTPRTFFVSGHEQQIFFPLLPSFGPSPPAATGAAALDPPPPMICLLSAWCGKGKTLATSVTAVTEKQVLSQGSKNRACSRLAGGDAIRITSSRHPIDQLVRMQDALLRHYRRRVAVRRSPFESGRATHSSRRL